MSVTATRFKTPPNTTDWSLSKYKSRSSEPCGAELHILSSDELTVEQGSAQMLAFSCCGRQRPGKDALLIARVSGDGTWEHWFMASGGNYSCHRSASPPQIYLARHHPLHACRVQILLWRWTLERCRHTCDQSLIRHPGEIIWAASPTEIGSFS